MKKVGLIFCIVFGYAFLVLSIMIFFTMIFQKIPAHVQEGAEKFGYYLGQSLVLIVISFLSYFLLKKARKLGKKEEEIVSIDDIGK